MRSIWPRSLLARNFLLLMALTVALECSAFAVFYQLVQRPRTDGLASLLASQINAQRMILSYLSPAERSSFVDRVNRTGEMRIVTDPPLSVVSAQGMGPWASRLVAKLEQRLPVGSQLMLAADGHALVRVYVDKEAYWFVLPIQAQLRNRTMTAAVVVSIILAGLSLLGAWLIQRRINRPLRQLQRAARAVGDGQIPERLDEQTPVELSAVSRQFNWMAENLERNDSLRALMLAGISHDIRTPLTKLRLTLALGQLDDRRASLYISQIDRILEKFLDFGRSECDEAVSPLEVNTLVKQLVAEFEESGNWFAMHLDPTIGSVPLRANALQRAISNLMENAVRYGKQGLAVQTQKLGGLISISVNDQGSGIPAEQIEHLRRPFTRADAARAGSGGAGLGLAIVDRLARVHGGYLKLRCPQDGGLQATLFLPVQKSTR